MQESVLCVTCPHCAKSIMVYVEDINCSIFRHGVYKETGLQMDPHAPKNVCDTLAKQGKIYGCGKPFKLVRKEHAKYIAEACEYI